MSSNSDQPSFSGSNVPMKVSIDVDDDIGEETTRRVGVAPSFQPSFQPMNMMQMGPGPSITPVAPAYVSNIQTKTATTSIPSIPSGWKLNDAPVLPEFHPLDRTATFIAHTSAAQVASRISKVLQQRSIDATFDSTKAKVTCRTAENVDFRIRLYKGRSEYAHGIIVEVQRRFGSSVSFCDDSSAILEAAQGKIPSPPPMGSKILTPAVMDEDDEDVSSISSLDFVAKMLRFDSMDSQLLALQTLSSLTDPSKMGVKTAKGVSRVLVSGANEVGAQVVAIIADASNLAEDDNGRRLFAMTVLSNAFQQAAVPPAVHEQLRPVLLKAVTSEDSTQQAYLAALCLEHMMTTAEQSLTELHTALTKARDNGKAKHQSLYEQAQKCLDKLDGGGIML